MVGHHQGPARPNGFSQGFRGKVVSVAQIGVDHDRSCKTPIDHVLKGGQLDALAFCSPGHQAAFPAGRPRPRVRGIVVADHEIGGVRFEALVGSVLGYTRRISQIDLTDTLFEQFPFVGAQVSVAGGHPIVHQVSQREYRIWMFRLDGCAEGCVLGGRCPVGIIRVGEGSRVPRDHEAYAWRRACTQ